MLLSPMARFRFYGGYPHPLDWLTVLDLSGIDHFLDMASMGWSDRTLLYRPETPRIFIDTVVEWLDMQE